ncbi:hypothetical protein TNCV_3337711 [Trichonephila clavipes]|nr:hypothetical protein TNCV_3337711 [Trichonephila clavipes]
MEREAFLCPGTRKVSVAWSSGKTLMGSMELPDWLAASTNVVGGVSIPKGRKERCQSLRKVGLLHDRWRHHLSPSP